MLTAEDIERFGRVGRRGMDEDKGTGGVQSAEVALHLLRVLAEEGGNMPLSRLASCAKMPAAKAHRYVVSLMRAGFVDQAGRYGYYSLGAQALHVGLVALGRLDVMDLATAGIFNLCDEIDQTTMLAIWSDNGPVVVRWIESSRPVTVNIRTGSIMPLLRSATGSVFAAWMPWAKVEPLLKAELAEQPTGFKASSLAEARAVFEAVRNDGLAIVSGAMLPGIQAIGAPVFNMQGSLEAVVTVLGTVGDFDASPQGRVAEAVRRAARTLSQRLGHRMEATRTLSRFA